MNTMNIVNANYLPLIKKHVKPLLFQNSHYCSRNTQGDGKRFLKIGQVREGDNVFESTESETGTRPGPEI